MRALGLAAAAVLLQSAVALAQDTGMRCNAINTDSTRELDVKVAPGVYNAFFGGGVVVVCPDRNLRLAADSAEEYGLERRIHLVGNVHYREPRFTLRSDVLTYFMNDERVVATGHVDATLPNGSTLKGPIATYLRPIPGTRPLADLQATGRPTTSLVQLDSAGRPTPPTQVTADRLHMQGDSLVYAGGRVDIVRQDLTAHADSMFLDGRQEIVHLRRDPRIEGTRGARPFTLTATLIDLFSTNQELTRVLARGTGTATTSDLVLRADTIDFRVTDDLLQRAYAWGGPQRASARSPADSLLADSLDVVMPDQRVREIRAVGSAYGQSRPDTVKFRTDAMDWLRGDTIRAFFDTTARDTTHAPRIQRLVAERDAKAFYNMAPQDTTLCAPAVSYSLGHRIVVSFSDKGVERVDVQGKTYGVLAEPTDSLPANRCPIRSDSTGRTAKPPVARPDTLTLFRGIRQ